MENSNCQTERVFPNPLPLLPVNRNLKFIGGRGTDAGQYSEEIFHYKQLRRQQALRILS